LGGGSGYIKTGVYSGTRWFYMVGKTVEVKSVDPMSYGKLAGVIGAVVGLLMGLLAGLFAMIAGGGIFGLLPVIMFPLLYGIGGAIGAAIGALIYNISARSVGGIKVEFDGM
jgi:predicted lipid-binding transport protein (Tim44 family)